MANPERQMANAEWRMKEQQLGHHRVRCAPVILLLSSFILARSPLKKGLAPSVSPLAPVKSPFGEVPVPFFNGQLAGREPEAPTVLSAGHGSAALQRG